jgi:MoxR-like ATPase
MAFAEDGSRVALSVGQGVTNATRKELASNRSKILEGLDLPAGFNPGPLPAGSLGASSPAQNYEHSMVAYRLYERDALPDSSTIEEDVRAAIECLLNILQSDENRALYEEPAEPVKGLSHMVGASQHVWVIAPGRQANKWDMWKSEGVATVGWDGTENLNEYTSREEILPDLTTLFGKKKPTNDALTLWSFAHVMQPGDLVLAKRGRKEIIGWGVVTSDYRYQADRESHRHVRDVDWRATGSWHLGEKDMLAMKTLTDISGYPAFVAKMKRLVGIDDGSLDDTDIAEDHDYWIFQANPNKYDIDRALANLDEMTWSARQHVDRLKPGDIAYIWRSGKESGIVAKIELTDGAREREADPNQETYTLDTEALPSRDVRVVGKILARFDPILSKDLIAETPGLENLSILRYHQGTNFPVTKTEAEILESLEGTSEVKEKSIPYAAPYTLADFANETGYDEAVGSAWLARLRRKKQIVFQGPPGTGKTYVAQRLARLLLSETQGVTDLVQFHPSYAYEDFMQGIRPKSEAGTLIFDLEPGRFMNFCRKAERRGDAPCVLIIDEINRANLSRVFGELMYLLEYRDAATPLASGGKPFKIPKNVYLIGTMNTADRSIALIDHAFRRRFSFIFLGPEYPVLERYLEQHGLPSAGLIKAVQKVNTAINDRNYEVGISFFLADGASLKNTLREIWQGEIEPYLDEYFYGQESKVEPLRWTSLVKNELQDWA